MKPSQSLLLIFICIKASSFFIDAADDAEYAIDLNVPLSEERDAAGNNDCSDWTTDVATTNNDGETFESSIDTDSNTSYDPRSRANKWNPYVAPKLSKHKIEKIREKEEYLISKHNNGLYSWADFFNLNSSASKILCTKIWASLPVTGLNIPIDRKCDPGIKIVMTVPKTMGAAVNYIGIHSFLEGLDSIYQLDLLRCNCKYVKIGKVRAANYSKTFFFVHQVAVNQYIILTTVKPNPVSRTDRTTLHVIDYFENL